MREGINKVVMAVVAEICGHLEVDEDILDEEERIDLDNGDDVEIEKVFQLIKYNLRYTGYTDIVYWDTREIILDMYIEPRSFLLTDDWKVKHKNKMEKYIIDQFKELGIKLDITIRPGGAWRTSSKDLNVIVHLALDQGKKD